MTTTKRKGGPRAPLLTPFQVEALHPRLTYYLRKHLPFRLSADRTHVETRRGDLIAELSGSFSEVSSDPTGWSAFLLQQFFGQNHLRLDVDGETYSVSQCGMRVSVTPPSSRGEPFRMRLP